jgi:hypothetical protein
VKTGKRGQKGPPKSFESLREARAALTHLADSLATYHFPWPAAAIRSFLSGGSQSLDEAFGVSFAAGGKQKAEKMKPAEKPKAKGRPAATTKAAPKAASRAAADSPKAKSAPSRRRA